jgi:hypothetical protein
MGIALLLLVRTLGSRPKRTLLFLLGYGLATAVMVTLLAVGEAVLQQARDKDLLGGGDLILVPQGIDLESMKVGGITALYYSIPEARFLVRQVLRSSRFRSSIDTVSPYIVPKLVYLRQAKSTLPPVTCYAEGSLPDQENRLKTPVLPWKNNPEDNLWTDSSGEEFYHNIDHFHLPSVDSPDMKRWAEWHYFNFESTKFYGYLSIMVAGNILKNEAQWVVSLQIYDESYKKYTATYPASKESLPLRIVDYHVGSNNVRFEKDHYEIDLDFQDRVAINGHLSYYPAAGLYFPPTFLVRTKDFESGYVIPAIRGKYEGTIRIGNATYDFHEVDGYHDHNWGIWRQIVWNWGHAFSNNFAIFFGEIFLNDRSKGLFAGIYDRNGFVTLFRPESIRLSNYENRVPRHLQITAEKRFSAFTLSGTANRFVTTPLEDSHLEFVQLNMNYALKLMIDGKEYSEKASGNAETFVSTKPTQSTK